MIAQDVIDFVGVAANDLGHVAWPTSELISYINNAGDVLVSLKPDAAIKTGYVACASNTKQDLPADGVSLVRVLRNVANSAGGTPTKALRFIDAESLDASLPLWHEQDTAEDYALDYGYDERNPTVFYVYPWTNKCKYYILLSIH